MATDDMKMVVKASPTSQGSGPVQGKFSKPISPNATGAASMAESPDPEQRKLEVLKAVFEQFDANHNGTMESCELREVMKQLGWSHTDEEVERALQILDKDGNGTIELEEFVKFGQYARKQRILKKHGSFEEFNSKSRPPQPMPKAKIELSDVAE
mmetsp:Transcript_16059/g.22586  ORF Transcript_16059/g.22586 Transcript_16059/m.22586 type:complete len:155 (+) Transcript_16059:55-519(+)|eukprot:CAMPEP_0175090780 /NCGR_PEP_ID=MMETSP0086_2-20121207/1542_1 /TAXON_ID=136419 /ORGANISM="Unknown Unknown, Strain D1" /LENGTH=154 /DNA_ID=CAMNT_0016363459 /DNA_START=80 /DNA_END=544 /DNA_ORIENTATION=+